jgi:hypothetical protein
MTSKSNTTRTAPHGEHTIVLLEDAPKAADRIYEITNKAGSRIGILGSELSSLAEWWRGEAARPA